MIEKAPENLYSPSHAIGPESFWRESYRLLCHVLASREIAGRQTQSSPRDLIMVSETEEVSKLLVHVATYYRIKYDDESWEHGEWLHQNFSGVGSLAEDVSVPEKSTSLSLRDACNKIIHANRVLFDLEIHPVTGVEYITPRVFLYGTKGKLTWRAELDVVRFCEACSNVIA